MFQFIVEPYLRQCIESILNQTYRDLEILLIDDGSPDKCGDICDEYARNDQRIRVFHTENRGLSAARNLGLREAKGDYIGFVDSDDWIEPDMYEVLLRRVEETGADIGVCGFVYEYRNKSEASPCVEAVYDSNSAIRALICGDLRNQVINKLWKRYIALRIHFPEGHVYEDILTVYQMILDSGKVSTIRDCFYHYRQRKGSISRLYSMQNLIDYWDVIHTRYENLGVNHVDVESELRKQCASAIGRTWRWFYKVPKSERDYEFLTELNQFAVKNYRLLGERDWHLMLRVYMGFAHYNSAISLGCACFLNNTVRNMRFRTSLWE